MKRHALVLSMLALAACSEGIGTDEAVDDQAFTATDSADPVLFALDNVKSIELAIAPADVKTLSDQADAVQAQSVSAFVERPKVKGTFTYKGPSIPVTPTCDVSKPYDITVKIKGMASVQGFDKKPSLRIDFDKAFCGLKNLALNNMVQDNTLVNEALAYKMYAAVGVPVPRLGYSQVAVNGQAMGVYLTLETVDKNFLTRNFDDATGPLYEGTYGGDLRTTDIGTPKLRYTGNDKAAEATDPKLLKALIAAVNTPGDAVFYGTPATVDTNEFLNMMAMAYVIGDWDNYITANNYRIYRSPKTGLWSFIPTGTDQTFAEKLHPFRGYMGRHAPFSILFEKCIGTPRCLVDYQKHLATAVEKLKEPGGTLKGTAERRASLIEAAVKNDRRRPASQADAALVTARAALGRFIDGRAADVATAAKCMSGGVEVYPGACAGRLLRNVADRRCLDSLGDNQVDGARIVSHDCHGAANQRLLFKPVAGDEFELRMSQSDKCLDVPDRKLDDGLQLQQFACTGGPNQRFTMKSVAGGVQWVAKHSGKCLALGAPPSNDVAIVQAACSADRSQVWTMAASLFD